MQNILISFVVLSLWMGAMWLMICGSGYLYSQWRGQVAEARILVARATDALQKEQKTMNGVNAMLEELSKVKDDHTKAIVQKYFIPAQKK
jgi:hypothetical protein